MMPGILLVRWYPIRLPRCFGLMVFIVMFFKPTDVLPLKITSKSIPPMKLLGDSATLICNFDLEDDVLYTLKWFKGMKEFYRYSPKNNPASQFFPMPGVLVEMSESDGEKIVLKNLTMESEGQYHCMVSGEGPSFNTVTYAGNMSIGGPPSIHGAQPTYQLGSQLEVNCSNFNMKSETKLVWYINDGEVSSHFLINYYSPSSPSTSKAVLGLKLNLYKYHFRDNVMRLTCKAFVTKPYNMEFSEYLKYRLVNKNLIQSVTSEDYQDRLLEVSSSNGCPFLNSVLGPIQLAFIITILKT